MDEFETVTVASLGESLIEDFSLFEDSTELSESLECGVLLCLEKDLATTSFGCFAFISPRAIQASSLFSNSIWQNL